MTPLRVNTARLWDSRFGDLGRRWCGRVRPAASPGPLLPRRTSRTASGHRREPGEPRVNDRRPAHQERPDPANRIDGPGTPSPPATRWPQTEVVQTEVVQTGAPRRYPEFRNTLCCNDYSGWCCSCFPVPRWAALSWRYLSVHCRREACEYYGEHGDAPGHWRGVGPAPLDLAARSEVQKRELETLFAHAPSPTKASGWAHCGGTVRSPGTT